MITETLFDGSLLYCDWVMMGQDCNLAVWGGTRPHIGSAVLSVARQSLTGSGVSATSSVLNLTGHKDEAVARLFAESVAKKLSCTAVCSCGIHLDALSAEQLVSVRASCERLLARVLASL